MDRTPKEAVLVAALQKIALGAVNKGTPLPREEARQVARKALADTGEGWNFMADIVEGEGGTGGVRRR
jgi:hypothetical protein